VAIGRTDDWAAIRVSPWTFFFRLDKEGRFPDIDRQVPKPSAAVARCQLDHADVDFLCKSLPKLPCDETYNYPVTVELNGNVAIRAKAEMQDRPTELVLSRSTCSGQPIRINMNRKFLARAVKLGFQELAFYDPKAPVLCQDECRTYVWAVLEPDSAVAPADDAIRIISSEAVEPLSTPKPKTPRRIQPVPQPASDDNGHAKSNGQTKSNGQSKSNAQPGHKARHKADQQQGIDALIEQAEQLRTAQRENLVRTNDLVKALKRHRRQSRIVQNTLASLRQLKTIGV
jgi:hypothetical protein